ILYWNGNSWNTIEAGSVGQILGINASGQPSWHNGSELFSLAAPSVTNLDPSNMTTTSTTLNAGVNANGFSTTVLFEYGTTESYGNTVPASESTITGSSITNVSADISGLSANETYHFRIVATNAVGTSRTSDMTFTTDPLSIIDSYGNSYDVVRIGSQLWITTNLRTTEFNDGTAIPYVTDDFARIGLTTPGYCWYDNNEALSKGALYNWYAVNNGNLCPAGWHVPDAADWNVLGEYVGGPEIAGEKLKATSGWVCTGNGTDEFGFIALPNGNRYANDGGFYNGLYYGYWWVSDSSEETDALAISMSDGDAWSPPSGYPQKDGFSVRCIKY
ncbi:MAG: hypothetical protein JXR56_04120, partial [Candidatus Cloacimonetes bacterium]|nr:hypothetical protein [Candidatus Cloacimonadota bacterium]